MSYNFNNRQKISKPEPPDEWIYKNYLEWFKEPMDGRRIRLKSIFNNERTPSMYLYPKQDKYIWKDHSSGKSGDAIDLARYYFEKDCNEEVSYYGAVHTINHDYRNWKRDHGEYIPYVIKPEFHAYTLVCEYVIGQFKIWDLHYWKEFGVDKDLLDKYRIKSLASFRIGKKLGDNTTQFNKEVSINYSYGFFDENDNLIKIYNPNYVDLKHISVKKDILGRAQLGQSKTLLITSSMKDLLSVKSLYLDIDVIAPMSEKTIIPVQTMDDLKNIYPNILVAFDNDKTGIRAMMLYKSLYNIDYVYVPHYKDLAEYKQKAGAETFREDLIVRINSKIYKGINHHEEYTSQKKEISQIPGTSAKWRPVPGFEGF